MPIQSVCVYCGSSDFVDGDYKALAKEIGRLLARRGLRVIYGGGHVGLMGVLADSALENGGEVIGIIPEHICEIEKPHNGLTEFHVVKSMHTRKEMMAENSQAFVILPGGFGTMDEAFEILVWKQLGLHDKPVIIFNYKGFWDPLLKLIDNLIEHKFAAEKNRKLFAVVDKVEDMMKILET